jgi:hypothetical protein
MQQHQEIPIKVNAWVDEGIAPLVTALNKFDDLMTMCSCEDDDGRGYVMFACRGDSHSNALFAAEITRELRDTAQDLQYSLVLNWESGSEDDPVLTLSCPRNLIPLLARAVSAVAHKRASGSDTTDTEPRSSRVHRAHRPPGRTCGGIEPLPA